MTLFDTIAHFDTVHVKQKYLLYRHNSERYLDGLT